MVDIIDVSKYQGLITWSKVTASTVIIRVGYRSGKTGKIVLDSMFERNISEARKYGKKVGIYFWSQALTIDEARAEADFCAGRVNGKLDLPIFLDSEGSSDHKGRADNLPRDARTVTVVAFCTRIMERGYKAGVYSGQSWWKTGLDYEKLKNYSIWVARYSAQKPSYPPRYDYWQYSSQETMDGITGRVDASVRYGETPGQEKPVKEVMLGQASKGETGFTNQKPGNQTGRELNIVKYYTHVKGWRVFRAPTPTAQHRIAYAALRAIDNLCVGYDQTNRNTLFEAAQKYGYDPGAVHIDVECDCSSLVRVCCAYAGYVLPDFTTGNEANVLLRAGFKEVGLVDLQLGDILVTKTKGHTCVVVQI